tara:strand:+ start:1189 stop:1539 length:351 start_codon:yes stop_codon:yes gene_type:complete
MYLQNIMSNYLSENVNNFSVENQFKPLKVKKDTWEYEEKRVIKNYKFKKRKFLEAFIIQLIKYNREADASIEFRVKDMQVGCIVHALSHTISEIEIEATKDLDKIKKDVMYYYADK